MNAESQIYVMLINLKNLSTQVKNIAQLKMLLKNFKIETTKPQLLVRQKRYTEKIWETYINVP
jgi:hypothetical protein